MFKLVKCAGSIISRIQFQSNSDDEIEAEISKYNSKKLKPLNNMLESQTKDTKLSLKRKLNDELNSINVKNEPTDNVINIISDSDNETKCTEKKIKLIPKIDDVIEEDVKYENEDIEYEAFNVKQEYLRYDDEPIQIDSDSDSESEQWFLRLSQNSPGKPFTKIDQKSLNSDLSKFKDIEFNYDEVDFIDDIITIPPEPPKLPVSELKLPETEGATETSDPEIPPDNSNNVPEKELHLTILSEAKEKESEKNPVYEVCSENNIPEIEKVIVPSCPVQQNSNILKKKTQMIEPRVQLNKRKSSHSVTESKSECFVTLIYLFSVI